MSKTKSIKILPTVDDSAEEFLISGKAIKEQIEKNERVTIEFNLLEEMLVDSMTKNKILEKKNEIFETEYHKLEREKANLEDKLATRISEEARRKKYEESNHIQTSTIKVDKQRAERLANEKFKKEGLPELEEFMKQFSRK